MTTSNNNTNNSDLLTYIIKFMIWLPLIIVILLIVPFLLHISGLIEISTSLSLIVEYGPLFTFSATLFLVSITAYYSYTTNKIANSNTKNVRITQQSSRYMGETIMHQVILEIQKNYRTQEMGLAVRSLWDFYDEFDNKVKKDEKYNQRIKKFKNEDNKEKYNKKIFEKIKKEMLDEYKSKLDKDKNYILDVHRRLVSYFYQHLYDISQIDSDFIKYIRQSFWEESNQQTIEFILIPMESKIVEMINDKKRIKIPPLKEKCSAVVKLENLCNLIRSS
jgi:hypothetical protein